MQKTILTSIQHHFLKCYPLFWQPRVEPHETETWADISVLCHLSLIIQHKHSCLVTALLFFSLRNNAIESISPRIGCIFTHTSSQTYGHVSFFFIITIFYTTRTLKTSNVWASKHIIVAIHHVLYEGLIHPICLNKYSICSFVVLMPWVSLQCTRSWQWKRSTQSEACG